MTERRSPTRRPRGRPKEHRTTGDPEGDEARHTKAIRPSEPVRKTVKRSAELPTGSGDTKAEPETSARYTPKKSVVVMRPGWHRIFGWAGVVLGLVIVILNDAMQFGEGLTLLPFGHSELYLMLGIAIAGGATWFLGLFDRQTVYR